MDDDSERIEDEFKCKFCLRLFEDALILPCGHSFCRKCLDEHLDNEQGSDSHGNAGCPSCKVTSRFSASELRSNGVLNEVATNWGRWRKRISIANHQITSCQICEELTDVSDLHLCDDCNIRYCTACRFTYHPAKGILAEHNFKSLEEKKHLNRIESESRCALHKKEYVYFCVQCNVALCCDCGHYKDHIDHRLELLSQAYTEELNTLRLSLDTAKSFRKKLLESLENSKYSLESMQATTNQRISYIQHCFEGLKRAIDEKESVCVTKEREKAAKFQVNHTDIAKEINVTLSDLEFLVRLAEKTVADNRKMTVLLTTDSVVSGMQECFVRFTSPILEGSETGCNHPLLNVIDITGVTNELALLDVNLGKLERKQTTASFVVEKISELGLKKAVSEKWTLGNHLWYMEARRSDISLQVGLILIPNAHSKFLVDAEFRLLRWDPHKDPHTKAFSTQVTFDKKYPGWSKNNFLDWAELMHPENDFIRNDMIRLQLHMSIE